MNYEDKLRTAIARVIAVAVDDQSLSQVCIRLGLEGGEVWYDRIQYIEGQLDDKPLTSLLKIGADVLRDYNSHKLQTFRLKEALRIAKIAGKRRISEITRQNIFDELLLLGFLPGKLELDNFLRRIWPIDEMASGDPRRKTFAGDLWQHMVINDDWSQHELLDRLDALELSDEVFGELLELIVYPTVRHEQEQTQWLEVINRHLIRDGFILVEADKMSGYPVYRIRPIDAGVLGTPKNLIFASNGPKPEIVLTDAIHNDLRVVRNAEYCLFYGQPIPEEGLFWRDLVAWWGMIQKLDVLSEDTARHLYLRLKASLASAPETMLFHSYFKLFNNMRDRLPALIPQVYLHYDPKTVKELYGEKRLSRQRMDFLLLLGHGRRIVVEIDGVQHYSSKDGASPRLYAEMVEADRQLRLCGYEVYRFGGAEFSNEPRALALVQSFFELLFKKHQI